MNITKPKCDRTALFNLTSQLSGTVRTGGKNEKQKQE